MYVPGESPACDNFLMPRGNQVGNGTFPDDPASGGHAIYDAAWKVDCALRAIWRLSRLRRAGCPPSMKTRVPPPFPPNGGQLVDAAMTGIERDRLCAEEGHCFQFGRGNVL
jgi:hypothetical protein